MAASRRLGERPGLGLRSSEMITIEDCVAFCGLTQEEVEAVSEHEHVPETAAAALASHLLNRSGGAAQIRQMIVDDIHDALDEGRVEHAAGLFNALRHFLEAHAEAKSGTRPS